MSHTVTITKLPDETSDDVEYVVGGTHDSRCEVYSECRKDWHRHPNTEDYPDDEWSTKRAGHHHLIEGMWMTLVDQDDYCALRFVFEGYSAEETFDGLNVGETRDVKCEWDGEGWSLFVLPAPASLTPTETNRTPS